MKGIVVILSFLFSLSVFADENYSKIVKVAFEQSEDVVQTIQSIQSHFDVQCGKGKITLALWNSKFPKVATWKGLCESLSKKLVLTIKSKFKMNGHDVVFSKKSIKVQSLFIHGMEEDFIERDSLDPFVNAYKRSAIVKDIRRFVEDETSMNCKVGKAHRGSGLYAAKYTYNTECSNENSELNLKIKSKVELVSDTSFKFNLKEFKICY